MAYTETSTTSYWSRLWNSLKGILLWIVLLIISVWLLWWNEGRTIKITQWLSEWEKVTVNWKISPIDNTLDWKLIYINWKADTSETLKDETFFVSDNSIKLIRKVEMFQWNENQRKESKDNLWWSETTTTTYTYQKIWDDKKLSSSNFKESWHNNPTYWQFESLDLVSKEVKVWDIKLTNTFINQLNKKTSILIKDESFNKFEQNSKINNAKNLNNIIYIWSWTTDNPIIWDLKVSFSVVYPLEVSIIWKQEWKTITSYKTKTDTNIDLLQYWTISIQDMYEKANSDNIFVAWLLRWLWLILMFIWFRLIFWLFITLAKVIPMLSSLLSIWVWLVAFILTLVLWWTTIIIAWFFVRPIISIIVFIIVVWAIFAIKKYASNKK